MPASQAGRRRFESGLPLHSFDLRNHPVLTTHRFGEDGSGAPPIETEYGSPRAMPERGTGFALRNGPRLRAFERRGFRPDPFLIGVLIGVTAVTISGARLRSGFAYLEWEIQIGRTTERARTACRVGGRRHRSVRVLRQVQSVGF